MARVEGNAGELIVRRLQRQLRDLNRARSAEGLPPLTLEELVTGGAGRDVLNLDDDRKDPA